MTTMYALTLTATVARHVYVEVAIIAGLCWYCLTPLIRVLLTETLTATSANTAIHLIKKIAGNQTIRLVADNLERHIVPIRSVRYYFA